MSDATKGWTIRIGDDTKPLDVVEYAATYNELSINKLKRNN